MTTTTAATRVLFPIALAAALAAVGASPASAAAGPNGPVTATYASAGVGYNNVLEGHAAGTSNLSIEGGDTVAAFCVEFNVDLATTGTYTSKSYAASGIKNIKKAADIAIRHDSVGTKLAEPKAENAAAQLAIWHLTDNKDITLVPNAAIVARADELGAAAVDHAEGPSSFVLSASASVAGTGAAAKDTVVATVKTVEGSPVAAQDVTVVAGGKTLTGKTGADGSVKLVFAATAAVVKAAVSVDAVLPAGAVLVPAGKQAMVTSAPAKVVRATSIDMPAAPPTPTPTPTPTATAVAPVPTPTPTPVPTPQIPASKGNEPVPTQLPFTGGNDLPLWFAAAGVLAGGGFFARKFLKARRS